MPGQCNQPGRSCQGVDPDPNNPNAITLGQSTNQLLPNIYISVTNRNQVARLDTDTGAKVWQVNSYGVNPSRTAVALDGTVWVGNRCLLGGRDNDFTCSSMAHLDLNGNLICRADVPGWVRGVAIDADGNVWGGTWNGQSVWKVSGTDVIPGSPPLCRIMGSLNLGVSVYGLAVDGRGFLWTASSPAKKVRVSDITLVDTAPNPWFYGIAIDRQNRVWYGGWSGGGLIHRMDGDPPYTRVDVAGTAGVTAVTVHPDGSVWGSIYCQGACAQRGLYKVNVDGQGNPTGAPVYYPDPEGQSNHGVAVDRNGKLWSPQVWARGQVNRWNPGQPPNAARENLFPVDVGQELYTYSDMTGIQLRTITVREGHWFQDFDSGYAAAIWDRVEYTGNLPANTAVAVSVRAADNQAQFAGGGATAWCGPFTTNGAMSGVVMHSLSTCPTLNNHRWVQLDFKLSTTQDGVRPSVSNIKVWWSY